MGLHIKIVWIGCIIFHWATIPTPFNGSRSDVRDRITSPAHTLFSESRRVANGTTSIDSVRDFSEFMYSMLVLGHGHGRCHDLLCVFVGCGRNSCHYFITWPFRLQTDKLNLAENERDTALGGDKPQRKSCKHFQILRSPNVLFNFAPLSKTHRFPN